MFQYAFAKAYEVTNSKKVEADISFLQDRTERANFTLRDFELSIFTTSLPFVSGSAARFNRIIPKAIFRAKRLLRPQYYIIETGYAYSPDYMANKKAIYAEGYFQSEKYFAHISDVIRKEFTFRGPIDSRNQRIADKMRSENSVSLHVRRGDYLSIGANVCGPEYYEKAIKIIEGKYPNPSLFVFSDDIKWVIENIRSSNRIQYIDHNQGKDSFKDMFLMSQCKHNVIANSSFSWWGSWLNQNSDKITVAPLNWYSENNSPRNDIYGKDWIII